MTVTLTVDELKDYRRRCTAWEFARVEVVEAIYKAHITIWNSPDEPKRGMEEVRTEVYRRTSKAIQEFDLAHPFPKIFPDA